MLPPQPPPTSFITEESPPSPLGVEEGALACSEHRLSPPCEPASSPPSPGYREAEAASGARPHPGAG